jgi:hypothetical protein
LILGKKSIVRREFEPYPYSTKFSVLSLSLISLSVSLSLISLSHHFSLIIVIIISQSLSRKHTVCLSQIDCVSLTFIFLCFTRETRMFFTQDSDSSSRLFPLSLPEVQTRLMFLDTGWVSFLLSYSPINGDHTSGTVIFVELLDVMLSSILSFAQM